jgi:ribosome-interacting GTPase 1
VLVQALRPLEVIPFSSLQEEAIAALPARLFRGLHKIRVYTKKPGYPFEKTAPYVFASGTTVVAAAATIHKDLAEQMKEAKIWGSAKHDGVAVPRDHVLEDGDIVELHV